MEQVQEFVKILSSSDLIWQLLLGFALLLLFRSVPQSTIDKLKAEAAKTDTPADDIGVKVLEWLNANPTLIPDLLKRDTMPSTPTLPAPVPPVITVSQPPVSVEIPHTITRNFDTTDSSFEKTVNGTRRVAHVPTNTSPLFSNRDGAGKEYPYPSVNVNPAYGVQFDIAYIAGAWGFTVLETLVSGVAYKVRLEYAAKITGDKKDNSSEWLWHELEINGNVTGANQGISNGVSYAEWGITGGDLPVMITPRLRCQWASAADESKVSWQWLIIEPVA